MIIRNCNVIGVERIEGTRKSDNKPFGFWKLHLTAEFPIYNGKPAGNGYKVLSCNVNDDDFRENDITEGSAVDVYSKGQYTDFIGLTNA